MRYTLTIVCLLALMLSACLKKKTFLSNEAKKINPYVTGQTLNFISQNGDSATLGIVEVRDGRFPDGLGSFPNERLAVVAYRESQSDIGGTRERILTILAPSDKDEERVDFCVSLKNAYLDYPFVNVSDYFLRQPISFKTRFRTYDDVLVFDHRPKRQIGDKEIIRFYWSKAAGYIRLVLQDGTVWDLEP